MRHQKVLVLGGSGFVGRHLINRLIRDGRQVTVPVRRRDKAKHLIHQPTVEVIEANIHDDAVLARLVAGQDAVVNLVGILQGSAADFERAHAALTRRTVAELRVNSRNREGEHALLRTDANATDRLGTGQSVGRRGQRAWSVERMRP